LGAPTCSTTWPGCRIPAGPSNCAQPAGSASPVCWPPWRPAWPTTRPRQRSTCGSANSPRTTSPTSSSARCSPPASLQLLVRDLGRPLGQDEADGAARLCAAVRGQPLRLRQAAALAATGQHTLQRLADRAERDPAALDRLSVHALDDAERRVLAVLALAAGAVLPGELVEIVSGVDDLAAQLDKLRRHGLVEQDHDRFGLPRCLGAGYRKLLVANLDIGAAVRPLTTWLAQRDPSSADALAAASAAVQLVGRLAERGDWPELARLAEVTARVLTLAGRWDLCRQVLLQGLHAAQQLGDLAAQARFAHDLGSMALCNDQLQQADELLHHALALREQLGDHEGAALTRHNLEIMTPPAPPVPPPAQPGHWRERWRKRLPALASLLGLFVFLLVLGLRVIVHAQPPPPTTSTTTTSTKPTTIRTSPPTTNVSHSGPGIAAPGTIQFPPTAIGAATTQPFAIGSIGTGQLRLGSFELSGDSADFAVNDHCRHHTLEPGQSCQPTVTFTPTAQGSRSATLTIHQNLPGPPTHVLLTGTGQPGSDLRPPILKTHDLVMEATSREGAIVGYSVTAIDDVDGDVPVQCQPASGTMFPFGTTHVSCTAADESGKTASGGFSVTVRDSRPPAMTVPDDVTVEAAGPDGAMVEFPQPTASDQVSGPAEARCAPLSGGTFPLGTTTVTCSAVDSHGNEGRASFNVVVRDTTPPKIGTREDILESMPIDDRIDPKLYRVTMAVSFDPRLPGTWSTRTSASPAIHLLAASSPLTWTLARRPR
jgi:hypothetical protein